MSLGGIQNFYLKWGAGGWIGKKKDLCNDFFVFFVNDVFKSKNLI